MIHRFRNWTVLRITNGRRIHCNSEQYVRNCWRFNS